MIDKIWIITKIVCKLIKNIVLFGFCIWVYFSFNELQHEIKIVQKQNTQSYFVQAQVYSKAVEALQSVAVFAMQIGVIDVERSKILANFISDLEEKLKQAESESLNRDKVIASTIQKYHEKPAYEYMKSMIVYLVQTYPETNAVSIGTGTIIKITDTETYILTNKHVCDSEDGSTCFVYEKGEKYPVTIDKRDKFTHDVQVLKTTNLFDGRQAVKGIKDVKPQDSVYMVGNNNGNPFMYSEGTVSGFIIETGDLLVGMPSGPGNSGSGIFTQDGYLAGLLYAGQMFPAYPFGASMDTAHGICVNSNVLRLFLSEYFSDEAI